LRQFGFLGQKNMVWIRVTFGVKFAIIIF
jgi:hypothetical protein